MLYLGLAAKSLLVGLGVGRRSSVAGRFRLCCPLFLYWFVYYKKDNARFLNVPILFSQHEHRILTGQKPYFKRVLPLFSKPYLSLVLIFSNNLICKKAAMKKGHKLTCVLAEAKNLIFI